MPSFNEHTGARISSGSHVKGTNKEKFDSGWDAIFGKKEVENKELIYLPSDAYIPKLHTGCADIPSAKTECESCCGRGWVETWGPKGEGAKDCEECATKNSCPHCDYGDFPCNLNCAGC